MGSRPAHEDAASLRALYDDHAGALLRHASRLCDGDLARAEDVVTFAARPNFKAIGARFGSRTQEVAAAIRAFSSAELAEFHAGGALFVTVDGQQQPLDRDDLELVQEARGDLVVEASGGYTVALDPTITPELRAEGLAREVVNRVQRLRKEAGLEVSDRIRLRVQGDDELTGALEPHHPFIASETLAVDLVVATGGEVAEDYEQARSVDLDGTPAWIALSRIADGGGA